MEISKKMQEALNKQINAELYSAYLYLSVVAYFESMSLSGFAHWMKEQAKEEIEHAMKIFNYVFERGGEVKLTEIDKPKANWDSPLAAFENAYKHEQHVTALIHKLLDKARAEKDHATDVFLHWFVEEQVEEEASAQEIVEKLKMIGSMKPALIVLDKKLGKRE